MQKSDNLLAAIEALPPERVAEIEDFVAFIAEREQLRALSKSAGATSEASFAAIWNNPDDSIYDAI